MKHHLQLGTCRVPQMARRLFVGISISLMGCAVNLAVAQTLTFVNLPTGSSGTAFDVNNDGVVVGAYGSGNSEIGFVWQNGVRTDLPSFGGTQTRAWAVSATGTVVGYSNNNSNQRRSFRTTTSGLIDISPSYNLLYSEARGISGTGELICGVTSDSRAWYWTPNTGTVELPRQPYPQAQALDVSPDGAAICGSTIGVPAYAIIWKTPFTGITQVIPPPNTPQYSGYSTLAFGVANSGTAVAGRAFDPAGQGPWRAFRWTQQTGFVDLGDLGGGRASAEDISADGSIVVGFSYLTPGNVPSRAFRWTVQTGMQNLNTVYACALNGAILYMANAVSPNGRYIVGSAFNPATGTIQPYLLDTQAGAGCGANGDVDNSGCVDDADLLQVLFSFGQTGPCLGCVDINSDGTVDDADLLIVLFNFGSGC